MGLQWSLAQAFDSIPEAKFGYKPTAAQLSIGYILANYMRLNNIVPPTARPRPRPGSE